MSWDEYTKSMMGLSCMKFAGIFGLDGNPWAVTKDFHPEQVSISQIIGFIRDKKLYGDGVTLNGNQYMVVRVDEDEGTCVMTRKNVPADADESQKFAAIAAITKQGLLVGIYSGGHANSGSAKKHVCDLQNYLKSSNY